MRGRERRALTHCDEVPAGAEGMLRVLVEELRASKQAVCLSGTGGVGQGWD